MSKYGELTVSVILGAFGIVKFALQLSDLLFVVSLVGFVVGVGALLVFVSACLIGQIQAGAVVGLGAIAVNYRFLHFFFGSVAY